MQRLLARTSLDALNALEMIVQGDANIMLDGQGTHHGLCIEIGRGQIVHHTPVAVRLPDVLHALFGEVTNMQLGVPSIEEHTRRCNQTTAADL